MNAGKSTSLLQSSHNYRERGMHTLVYTATARPARRRQRCIRGSGSTSDARHFAPGTDLFREIDAEHGRQRVSCVLLDEAQFLTRQQVDDLAMVVDRLSIPVLCYGLRTDFRGELFEGSARLLALADELTELKTICHCGRKATMVVRVGADGRAERDGEQVEIGGNERYVSLCRQTLLRGERTRASVLKMAADRWSPLTVLVLACVPPAAMATDDPPPPDVFVEREPVRWTAAAASRRPRHRASTRCAPASSAASAARPGSWTAIFGRENQFSEYEDQSSGRAGVTLGWDEQDSFEVDTRFRASVNLPQINERFNATIGRATQRRVPGRRGRRVQSCGRRLLRRRSGRMVRRRRLSRIPRPGQPLRSRCRRQARDRRSIRTPTRATVTTSTGRREPC